jgi:acyl-CoA synthetase (AMP-forming)/AMP-acid ligase II
MDRQHRVRVAFGNGLRPDVWNQFKERFGIDAIGEFYAATEAPLGMFNMSRNDHALGAIGRNGWVYDAVMSFVVAVVEIDLDTDEPSRDKSGRCKKVKSGQAGELLFKLPPDTRVKFQGYFGNKKATSSKILRSVFREGDAWFRTGDLVIWDKEGRVYFTDRIGDTFRWKSENVSTAEVSQMMGLHPGIREANVYGVQLPRHDGRAGCAAVVLEGNPDEVLMRSLAEHAARTLPSYARPLFLRLVENVDTTGTHKHQKHQLRTEGVDPDKVDLSKVYWLSEGTYVPFTEKDWRMIGDGKAKL